MIYGGTISLPKSIGRKHIYEGYTEQDIHLDLAVNSPKRLIIVSAVGALNDNLEVGDIVKVKDLITVFYQSSTRGRNFTDLSQPFDRGLYNSFDLPEVTHAFMRGPRYETFADKRVLKLLGADVVGMSMTPEVIVCNRLGIPCVGLGIVTNKAFVKHSHVDVRRVVEESKEKLWTLVKSKL